jgi:hypothetical protein
MYYSRGTNKIIVDYIDNEKKTPYEAIYRFQSNVSEQILQKKHRRITDRIDSVMELVPELPKDFYQWIDDIAMIDSRYIYYNYSRKVNEGYCTHCKKIVPVKNPKHNAEGKCKCCRSKITFKAIKKAAIVRDDGYASIFQKTKEGFILRYFEINRKYDDYHKPEQYVTEAVRVFYNERFAERGTYEYAEFKHSGVMRWCDWEYTTYSSCFNQGRYVRASSLYDKNLKKVFENTEFQYCAIELFAKGLKGERFYPGEYLSQYRRNKFIEYLVKLKLYRITKEYIKTNYGHSELFEYGKRINEVLKVSKEQVKLLCDMNATLTELRILQMANTAEIKLSKDQIRWIADNIGRDLLINFMKYSTPHKVIRYLKEQSGRNKISNTASDYYDYLETCQKLNYDIRNPFIFFPKHLKISHDQVTEEYKEKCERIKSMKDDELNIEMEQIADEMVKRYSMKDKHFSIRVPWTCEEIKKEGHGLHHCVGTYVDKVLRRETTILFIRRIEDIDTPYYTMEVQKDRIIQVRGKNNNDPTPEVQEFVNKFKVKMLETYYERMAG